MGVSEEKIVDTGSLVIYVERDENKVMICRKFYPLYPHGNYIKNVISLEDNRLEYYTVRMSYGGTGRDDYGYVELSESEKRELLETMSNVKSDKDFDKLIEKFKELKEKREKIANDIFNEVVDELVELISTDERIRMLKLTKEEIKERASDFIEHLIEDC